jgi:hypothetical protein
MLIKMVGLVLLFSCLRLHALVPLEGIIMGEPSQEYQQDPLAYIFQQSLDTSQEKENAKLKNYYQFFKAGEGLTEQCRHHSPASYLNPWEEKQARRSVISTFQYIGLDQSIKAIGAYARELNLDAARFQTLKTNLVKNYCSRNITVYSLSYIEKALEHYYQRPEGHLLPEATDSPFATAFFKAQTATPAAREREFEMAIKNFRAFCSWGGDVIDHRMLPPYLNNPFLMAFVFKHLTGDETKVQVGCQDLICRKVPPQEFQRLFPRSIGSTGLGQDLVKMYCHHFRLQDLYPSRTLPQVATWMKQFELEDAVYETSFLISFLTGVPDPTFGVTSFNDLALVHKSSIDERWERWSKQVLNIFSHDLLFEESIKVRLDHRRDEGEIARRGYAVDLYVGLGELDRAMDQIDKIDLEFKLKLSKNLLRQVLVDLRVSASEADPDLSKQVMQKFADHLAHQLQHKEKKFKQPLWTPDFPLLLAEELVAQARTYQPAKFKSYRDEMLEIPIRFSFGAFALAYVRYRADVHAGRLKLKL